MIQSKCSFECDAYRTAPVRRTMFFYDINWDLAFLSRWRFWVWRVVLFCFLPCKTAKLFFLLIVMHFVPLQYAGPWFLWHKLNLAPSKSVCFLVGICSGCLLPPWFNQNVLLNVLQFVPLQYDLPWFLWHQLSSSFSFTLKILSLECVFFCFHPCKAVESFYLRVVMHFVLLQNDRPWFSRPY